MPRVLEQPLNPATLTSQQMAACRTLFSRGQLGFMLHSTQKKMKETWEESGSDEFLIFSSRQLGKTLFGLVTAIEVCIKQPGSKVFYFGPTLKSLSDIVNDSLTFILQFAPEGMIIRHKTELRWTIGESELRLYPLERAHVDKARGKTCKGLCVIEEGCFVDSDAWTYAYNTVIDALRLHHQPRLLINTTPAEDEAHALHTDLLPKLEALGATARYTIYDNPFISDEQIAKIRSRVTPEAFEREYMAVITRSETTTVIPEFHVGQHRAKLTAPAYANWILSVDQGGSGDPTAITLCYWDYQAAKFCVYREHILPVNTVLSEIIDAARALEAHRTLGPIYRYGDVAGQVQIEYASKGYYLITPNKGPGSFEARIQALRVAIQNGKFVIDESCKETTRQFISGQYNKQRTDFKHDASSHLDALASVLYAYQHRDESNPFPVHTYGNQHSHHLANVPQTTGLESTLKSLQGRFQL